ncbi:TRAP transporter small permease [Desulfovibrio psychrotolerans]|uniref:Tripartite ATP-independent periplasmic transporters DctQ component domain-containing protein n=1 Tax=Desulfovibrio psychrotolerans TaxID=415242 RepID=A0A7J0BY13_9BACT|nr:TRAP transporter small permease [Desulfovibrio psychrotolerans]GFM38573.1 hypothetical protein DSM19430T_32570 [Desulfovibrio psychrotolerans]
MNTPESPANTTRQNNRAQTTPAGPVRTAAQRALARPFAALQQVATLLDTLCRSLLFLSCAGMVAVIGAQVFFRYALNHSLFWSEELGRVLLVQTTFFGAAVAYRTGAHIGMDTLTARLSGRGRMACAALAHAACLFLFCVMAIYGFRFSAFLAPQTTASLGISRSLPFLAIPLSGCVMAVHSLVFLLCPLASPRPHTCETRRDAASKTTGEITGETTGKSPGGAL